jgi:hypothetical protein
LLTTNGQTVWKHWWKQETIPIEGFDDTEAGGCRDLLPILGREGSGGSSGFSTLFNGLDTVSKLHTLDQRWQLVVAVRRLPLSKEADSSC